MTRARRRTAGFTLIEVMISLGILALVGLSIVQILRALDDSYGASLVRMDRDVEGARTMDTLVAALRSADAEDLATVAASPLSSTTATFRRRLGFDGQTSALGEVERVRLDAAAGVLRWVERPGLPDERRLWSCDGVADLLAGEQLNIADDNGNGLLDEAGFALSRVDGMLWIGLTLVTQDPNGRPVERTWTTFVSPRN